MQELVIEWVDATHVEHDLTQSEAQTLTPLVFSTVGFLVAESEHHITVSSTRGYDAEEKPYLLRDTCCIPRPSVVRMKKLEVEED